jgi:hypothetical protein
VRQFEVGMANETIEEALLRVLAENADENGKVTATWQEIRGWIVRIKADVYEADVHEAAIHLKNNGHFLTAYFEGGPRGICNVVLRVGRGALERGE